MNGHLSTGSLSRERNGSIGGGGSQGRNEHENNGGKWPPSEPPRPSPRTACFSCDPSFSPPLISCFLPSVRHFAGTEREERARGPFLLFCGSKRNQETTLTGTKHTITRNPWSESYCSIILSKTKNYFPFLLFKIGDYPVFRSAIKYISIYRYVPFKQKLLADPTRYMRPR